jgi:hypothetical protein
VGKEENSYIVSKNVNYTTTMENIMETPQKTKSRTAI